MFWLKRQFIHMRKGASPRPEFRSELWSKLSTAYDARYPVRAPSRAPAFRFAVAGMCSLALFFAMGTGVYAYESPEVVEGHPLHFMKAGMEEAEGRLARTPEARARFHAKMMHRRLREAEHFFEKRRTVGPVLLQAAAGELDMSIEELREQWRDPESRQEIIDELSALNDRYAEVLSRVQEYGDRKIPVPEDLREKLRSLRP